MNQCRTIVCRHKFASNVIEKALTRATENDRRDLIVELMDAKPNGSNKIALLLKDPYANFPVQVRHSPSTRNT